MPSRFVFRKVARARGCWMIWECLQSPLCRKTPWVIHVFRSGKKWLFRAISCLLQSSLLLSWPVGLFRVGLSTICSRFPKKLPLISQKVAQKLLKKVKSCFLYMFVTKVSQKLLKKKTFFCCCSLHLFGLMQKYANCTARVRLLSKKCMSKYYASILIL